MLKLLSQDIPRVRHSSVIECPIQLLVFALPQKQPQLKKWSEKGGLVLVLVLYIVYI
jgi:hypothetical protein